VPLNPGVFTLTFTPPGQFVQDQYHTVPASSGVSAFTQSGSTIQTTTMKDRVENTAYAESTHKAFTPYNSNTSQVLPEWYIGFNGNRFRVLGSHMIPDANGVIYLCGFVCKQETG